MFHKLHKNSFKNCLHIHVSGQINCQGYCTCLRHYLPYIKSTSNNTSLLKGLHKKSNTNFLKSYLTNTCLSVAIQHFLGAFKNIL